MSESIQSRRDLLTKAFRYTILAVLGVISAVISTKRHKLIQQGGCINREICSDCEAFEKCDLPQALMAKEVIARESDGRK